MSEPEPMGLADGFSASLEDRSTLETVYEVALQLYEPTRVGEVAERADVTPETARKYLVFLTEVGVLTRTGDEPAEFSRNDAYFDWRETEHLRQEHTVADLETRLEALSESISELQDRYEAQAPGAVDPRSDGYDNVDRVYADLRRWADAIEEIDRIISVLRTESDSPPREPVAPWSQQNPSTDAHLHE